MLKEKSCRCGAAKKRFKIDIGEFFIGECCEKAGFDHLGNQKAQNIELKKNEIGVLPPITIDGTNAAKTAPSETAPVVTQPALGRGKLMDMTVPALKELAASKGIALEEGMNKKAIVAAILK